MRKRIAWLILGAALMVWPAPDYGTDGVDAGWCGGDSDCEMVWGQEERED